MSDVPLITDFDPRKIPYQIQVIKDIRRNYDYNLGCHQIVLSGSIGSAKSLLAAHLALTHCFLYPGARVGIGRRSMPDLRATLLDMILEHLGEETAYTFNKTSGCITFTNGSKIQSFSWADQRYKKFRSYKFSMFIIEELTENDTSEAYDAIVQRMGRMPNIPECVLLMCTNPDGPEHWAHEKFIQVKSPNKHVYYSRTDENPFLPASYISQLKENLDERMYQRMVLGLWVSIQGEVIYYSYSDANYRDSSYEVNYNYPIYLSWDQNIGHGKPMSMCLSQYIDGQFHFFNEAVVEGANTEDVCIDLNERGLLNKKGFYIITGDCSGNNRDTRSKTTDYQIIERYLIGLGIDYEKRVPRSNPPIRTRHNLVNGKMKNVNGEHNLFVYKDAPTLDKGFKLTKLKKNGGYIEDDGPAHPYQHITTAAGYMLVRCLRETGRKKQGMVQL